MTRTKFDRAIVDQKIEDVYNDPDLDICTKAAFKMRLLWLSTARSQQIEPAGDSWSNWVLNAGRGFGKTRVGAETFGGWLLRQPESRGCLIAPTFSDVRDTCFEGESGLIARIPDEAIEDYHKTYGQLHLKNDAIAKGFPMESPERLRGPQFHFGWADELCAGGDKAVESWDMYQFGLRLGTHPRTIITTTPKPMKLLRELMASPDTVTVRGSTYDNQANLAGAFLKNVLRYEGTDLGRQELHAEILDDQSASPLKRAWWRPWKDRSVPTPRLICISLDTAFKNKKESDATACTVWGIVPVMNRRNGVFRREWVALLLDAWKRKLDFPSLKAAAVAERKRWSDMTKGDVEIVMLVEDKGSGQSLLQEFAAAGTPAFGYNPGHDSKVFRAHLVSDLLLDGRVMAMVRPGQKGDVFMDAAEMVVKECESFGEAGSKEDDLVDSCTQAWSFLRDLGYLAKDSDTSWHTVSADPDDDDVEDEREAAYG